MKIRIFTEGSKKIGFGHITRCMSIYQAFQEKGLDTELIVNGDRSIEKVMEGTDYKLINWLQTDKLHSIIQDADIIVVDSYLAKLELYEIISKESLGVYIDDNNRINYPIGIVVNGSINAEKLQYPEKNGIKYLLGCRYMPLRMEFWSVVPKKIKRKIQSIMITCGGEDIRNMTPMILKTLEKEFPELKKNIIIGRGFNNIKEIKKLKSENVNLILYPDAEGMKETMLQSDLAISAGGQTLYELARLGTPTLGVVVSSNQLHNVKNWEEKGFCKYLGLWNNDNINKKVVKEIKGVKDYDLRKQMSETGKSVVDGLGALRIVKKSLNEYYLKNGFNLRKAEIHDMVNIHKLSNDLEIRKNSFKTAMISFPDHTKWFKNKLKDENSLFLICESNNKLAAQIRFEIKDDTATISISISEEFRGVGMGYFLMNPALKILKKFSKIKFVKAYIKKTNIISSKFFEKSGFKLTKSVLIDGNEAFEYVYILSDKNEY